MGNSQTLDDQFDCRDSETATVKNLGNANF